MTPLTMMEIEETRGG